MDTHAPVCGPPASPQLALLATAPSQPADPPPKAAPPAGAAAAAGPKRRRGDPEFAVRCGIDDVAGGWRALKAKGMAIQYPFELDTFQKEAVLHLEQGHSVGFLVFWGRPVPRAFLGGFPSV